MVRNRSFYEIRSSRQTVALSEERIWGTPPNSTLFPVSTFETLILGHLVNYWTIGSLAQNIIIAYKVLV